MKSSRGLAVLLVVAAMAAPAWSTPAMQRQAKEAGYPSTGCKYCHTFDTDHMWAQAKKLGISNLNCAVCHGNKLPSTGLNDRGIWLEKEKLRRKVPLDMAWLKDYVPPSPKPSAKPPKK